MHRWLFWAPAILLDPFDLYDNYIKKWLPEDSRLDIVSTISGSWFGPTALIILLFWASFLTFNEMRRKSENRINKLNEMVAQKIEVISVVIEQQGISTNDRSIILQGKFIKLAVRNIGISTIHSCRAWICGISYIEIEEGNPINWPIGMTDIQLEWSGRDVFELDLPHKKITYISILHSKERHTELSFWKIPTPNNMFGFFKKPGIYTIDLQITGENVPTEDARIEIKWTGEWDKVQADILNGKI